MKPVGDVAQPPANDLRERADEGLESALVLAGLGEIEETLLGILDLLARLAVEVVLKSVVDHVLADRDELAA